MSEKTMTTIAIILVVIISVPVQEYFRFDNYLGALCVASVILWIICSGITKLAQWWEKRSMRAQQINEARLEAEKRQNAETALKVEALLKQYTLHLPKAEQAGMPLSIGIDLVNKEVVDTVKKYKENTAVNYGKYNAISNELKTILACEGCQTENAKYIHLNENIDRIKSLKQECDAMFGGKIVLLNEDSELMFELKLAFQYLQNSKKCVSSGVDVTEFVSSVRPQELSMFRYDNAPVTLFMGQHYFCLFSQVILVFDEAGIFVNAIDPSALRIDVIKAEDELMMIDGEPILDQPSFQHIDEDSVCIEVGEVHETWLHTCRDGSPDLRYRDNPRYLYMTNRYEYTRIRFALADDTIWFEASSIAVYDAFNVLIPKYMRRCNDKHDSIPRLLQLMGMIGDIEDENLKTIIESDGDRADKHSYFCRLIEA